MRFNVVFVNGISYWRILEPILLGSIANIVINFIFNPAKPDFILEEFSIAIIFAILVTEINRLIDRKLEKKVRWTENLGKRFSFQLVYLTISLFIIINIIGNIYIWLKGDDFYSFKELMIINLSVFIIALLLTFFKWSIHFYKNWKSVEYNLLDSTKELKDLKSELEKTSQQIELQKGNSFLRIDVENIKFAKSELGIVWVYYESDKAVFNSSLLDLMELLPKYLFFQSTRNTVIRKDMVLSISSSTYGKISLKLKDSIKDNSSITISRLKAASFRKWYNSTSS